MKLTCNGFEPYETQRTLATHIRHVCTGFFSLGKKKTYLSPTALLKARNDLGRVFLILSGSGLLEPREKYPSVATA